MFDRYVYGGSSRTEYVPYEKIVTVNQAATEEQARYLDELREEARDNVLGVFKTKLKIGCIDIGDIGVFVERDFRMEGFCTVTVFLLGEDELVRISVTDDEVRKADSVNDVLLTYKDKLADALAHKIMLDSCAEALYSKLPRNIDGMKWG